MIKNTDKFFESAKRFETFMPLEADIDIQVLKGHLIIEKEISNILEYFLSKNNPLDIQLNNRMMFAQKLSLCWALFGDKFENDIWQSLKKLNSLRNMLAHSLEPNNFNSKVREFTSSVFESNEVKAALERMENGTKFDRSMYQGLEFYHAINWLMLILARNQIGFEGKE